MKIQLLNAAGDVIHELGELGDYRGIRFIADEPEESVTGTFTVQVRGGDLRIIGELYQPAIHFDFRDENDPTDQRMIYIDAGQNCTGRLLTAPTPPPVFGTI